jgi:hypothetical protein
VGDGDAYHRGATFLSLQRAWFSRRINIPPSNECFPTQRLGSTLLYTCFRHSSSPCTTVAQSTFLRYPRPHMMG